MKKNSMRCTQVGSTNEKKLLRVFQKPELTGSKASYMCVMNNVPNMSFTIRYFLQYLVPVGRGEEI